MLTYSILFKFTPPLRSPAFYEPPTQIISSQRTASLEEKIALFSSDPYCVTVTLSPCFHGGCLPYIGDTVDFKDLPIFPSDVQWK